MVALNDEIDLAQVHAIILAEHVGHLTIDLKDDQLRAFDDGSLPETRGTKIEVTAIVHGASLEYGDIDGIKKATVIVRHLSEIQWRVVATAKIVLSAFVRGEMPTEEVKML